MVKAVKNRNYVAKYAQTCGAGQHRAKKGQLASRERQKREWKREVQQMGV